MGMMVTTDESPVPLDRRFLALLRNGDEDTWSTVLSWLPRLQDWIAKRFRSRDVAEEAAGDAMLRMWANRDRINEPMHIRTFLGSVMFNAAVSILRRRRDTCSIVIPVRSGEARASREWNAINLASRRPWDYPEYVILSAETQRMVQRVVHELPDKQRLVVEHIGLGGLDYQTTADLLGVKIGTIRSRYHRARRYLESRIVSLWGRVVCVSFEECA